MARVKARGTVVHLDHRYINNYVDAISMDMLIA